MSVLGITCLDYIERETLIRELALPVSHCSRYSAHLMRQGIFYRINIDIIYEFIKTLSMWPKHIIPSVFVITTLLLPGQYVVCSHTTMSRHIL